ncbi:acyl-CoA thioesterase domain-containing protein [Mycobacterium sp. E2479]|uniref:acyl-CoA thioesterase domain-containing protein n=1 Tax=Mycobacterium sp. E2479 TaxID=1834134 RepID=UPI0007FE3FC8|nr:acyl-CoA thioesterase domain-containing protein [Mycobacterium sp. E2479]OBH50429.1 thioesterase [Mycobacterium sp. E2479]
MDSERAIFTQTEADRFVPIKHVDIRSRWADDHLQGGAIIGLAALALESRFGLPDFAPARLTVDLFKSARTIPTTTRAELVRDGRRIRNSVCTIEQDGAEVARAVLVQYRRSEPPLGDEWMAEPPLVAAPNDDDDSFVQLYSADIGWTSSLSDHQNARRKRVAVRGVSVVAGQKNSPFVQAAAVVDAASLVTNLGTAGLGYINGDVTLALARLPRGERISLQADTHWAADGIAVGTATLLDDTGPFGSGLVTALSNRSAQIDFASMPSSS